MERQFHVIAKKNSLFPHFFFRLQKCCNLSACEFVKTFCMVSVFGLLLHCLRHFGRLETVMVWGEGRGEWRIEDRKRREGSANFKIHFFA